MDSCTCLRRMRSHRWFFFFNDTATTEIYTLSLHDALPISIGSTCAGSMPRAAAMRRTLRSRSEEHTSELQSPYDLVCRLLLEKKKKTGDPVLSGNMIPREISMNQVLPSGHLQERVLIRHNDYDQCFPSVQFLHFFFLNDPATTEFYTLSLHDALPI